MDREEIINFYDQESRRYSEKRYVSVPVSYYQYFFARRLELLVSCLREIEASLPKQASFLEIGCADGVVMRAIEQAFPGRFASMVGTDISLEMIHEARRINENSKATFCMREELPEQAFDLVIELGVPIPDLESEIDDVKKHLKAGSHFILSLPGKDSLHTRFKIEHIVHIKNFRSYGIYDRIIGGHFKTAHSFLYGFFVPKLWMIPALGRAIQPMFESAFQKIAPEFFHEKIYLLKKKD